MNGNKYFYLYVLTDKFKIIGATYDAFKRACKKYLYSNNAVLKRIQAEERLNEEEAINFFIEQRAGLYLSK
ncbi:MAG: hypothetical protein KatS3mg101_1169 [Patescibacteria group bacterium]|nr:MAG: hypothetical protein KatS3mg101_1169 [Patescibacteria group bacterium]